MLNFTINIQKKSLHQIFQMAKFLTHNYSELVKKNKKSFYIYQQLFFIFLSLFPLSHFSILSFVLHHLYSSPIFACRRRTLPLHRQFVLVVVNLYLFVVNLSLIHRSIIITLSHRSMIISLLCRSVFDSSIYDYLSLTPWVPI